MNFTELLKNKYVLYFVLFIAFSNLLGFINTRNAEAVAVMLVVGFGTSYFSKNMIVILLSSVLLANIFVALRVQREGMKNKDTKNSKKSKQPPQPKKNKENMKNKVVNDEENDEKTKNKSEKESMRVSYPKNLDDAYSHLQNLMENGNLTKETQNLLQEQKQLMETLQTMTPTINNAMGMLKSINQWMPDMSNLNKLLGKN